MSNEKGPIVVNLEKGKKYAWCRCGLSKNEPFCDGSHKVTDITPMLFEAKKDGKAALCTCKKTKNPPYCDGSHAK